MHGVEILHQHAWGGDLKPRFCHITPVLSDLHWLPVHHRISFKIATVTYRVLQFQQPTYLASLIPRYYRREPSTLLHLCQYVFPHVKPTWQPPNPFHLLLRVSGMHCRIICRPSQLFLFSEELSNIIYSCLLTLTVVQNLVWSTSSMYLTSWYTANYCHRTARKYHAAHLIAFHLSTYDELKWLPKHDEALQGVKITIFCVT